MNRRFMGAAAALLMVIPQTSCSFTARDLNEVRHDIQIPPTMLFLGDSIPAGYGLDGYSAEDLYKCRSYANILCDRYGKELPEDCKEKMMNYAVSGAESSDLLELVESGKIDSELAESDAVVVSIGGNDLLGIMLGIIGKLGYNAETGTFDTGNIDIFTAASMLTSMGTEADAALDGFEENIVLIADAINARTDGQLYIQTLYDPLEYFDRFSSVTKFSDEKIGRFNDIIEEKSDGRYEVIDVAADFKGRADKLTNIRSFDIHPNAEGHEHIAEDVDAAFRRNGFSYTTEEYGEEYLTGAGYAAIAGGIAAVLAVIIGAIGIAGSKRKKRKQQEKR